MFQRIAPSRRAFLLVSVLFLIVVLLVPANVEASQDARKKPDEKSSANDPFTVPAGNSNELLAFINKIAKMRPRFRNIQELRDHLAKANAAIGQAVEVILADKSVDDATVTAAVAARFSLLTMSTRYDRTAVKTIEEFAKSLETNPRPGVIAEVEKQNLLLRIRGVRTSPVAKKKELVDDVD